MRSCWLVLTLWVGAAGCDFDSAFSRYCKDNPQCVRDASAGPEASPEAGPEAGPEVGPEAGPEAGPETGPEAGPDVSSVADANLVPETGRDRDRDGGMTIPPPEICQQNGECGPEEVCHPFAQVCMRLCRSTDDCPRWLDNCAEIRDPVSGAVRTPKVCQCSGAQNCSNHTSGFTCNFQDNLCEAMCASTQECSTFQPARVCDVAVGMCLRAIPGCVSNHDCPAPSQPRCDPVTVRCTGCLTNTDCESRPDGLVQCSSTGSCVPPR